MSFSIEGVAAPGERTTLTATIRHAQRPYRLLAWTNVGGNVRSVWGDWGLEDLFITSLKIGGVEQFECPREEDWLPLLAFAQDRKIEVAPRVKFDEVPAGPSVEVTVHNKSFRPLPFALDFIDKHGRGAFDVRHLSAAYVPHINQHFAVCKRRICQSAYVGDGLCEDGAKLYEELVAQTFLLWLDSARECARGIQAIERT